MDSAWLAVRRPLLGMVLVALAGTGLGLRLTVNPVWFALLAMFFAGGACGMRRRTAGTVFFYAGLFAVFCLTARMVDPVLDPRAVTALMGSPAEHLKLIGIVNDEPARVGMQDTHGRWQFPIKVEGVLRAGDWQRSSGRLMVLCPDDFPTPPAYGQRILVNGVVTPESSRARIARQGELGRLRLDRHGLLVLPGFHGHWLMRACLEGRAACARLLARGIEDDREATGLLNALMLGYREDLPRRLNSAFARTGTLHIVAISGSHVGIMALLLVGVLKSLGLSRPYWILALAPLLMLYAMATGLAASAVRACLMAVVFWSSGLLRRRPDGPSALALSAMIILAVEPGQLIDPGFLLSFGVVAGLMIFCPPFMAPMERWVGGDPWQLEAQGWFARAGRWCARQSVALVVLTVAAWLVSTPMTAYFFNLVSPIGLVANLAVVPLSFVILLTGCLALMTGAWFPLLGEIFNHANRIFVGLLLRGVEHFDRVPAGSIFVETPPVALLVLLYAILLAVTFGRRRFRAAALAVVAVLAFVLVWRDRHNDRVRLESMPIAAGTALFVDVPGSDDVLIDPGRDWEGRQILRHLRARGVDRLATVVLSRPTVEVAEGLLEILAACPVDEVWCVPGPRSPAFNDVLKTCSDQGVAVRLLSAGDSGTWAGRMAWEVIHPRGGTSYRNGAEEGLILRMTRGLHAVLFTSDGQAFSEAAAMGGSPRPRSDLWVVGRVGAPDIATEAWLDAVRPSVVILRDALQLGLRVEQEVAARLKASGAGAAWLDEGQRAEITMPSMPQRDSGLRVEWRDAGDWPYR